MLKVSDIDKTNRQTKEAWSENWHSIKIDDILEIFSYPRVKKMLDMVLKNIIDKGPVLEAGCGLGPWLIKLSQLGYDVVGVDYQEECVEKIERYDPKLRVFTADIRNMPFPENHFSTYLSFGVIEHFAEGPDIALKEAKRVLKGGGRALIFVPYRNIFLRLKAPILFFKRNSFIRRIFNKPAKAYYYQKYFTVKELNEALSKNGFSVDRIMPVDHIFSLVEFSGIFRNKNSYDGENGLAVFFGGIIERILPWAGAGSILAIAHKEDGLYA